MSDMTKTQYSLAVKAEHDEHRLSVAQVAK